MLPEPPNNPNNAIIASLSSSEFEAYLEVYYGNDPNGNLGGCQNLQFEAPIPRRLAVFEIFHEGLADANQRAQADPRMVQLLWHWSECMKDAGFPFSDRKEMLDDLARRVAPFEEMLESQWDEWTRLYESAPNGDLTALPAETRRLLDNDPTIPPEHLEDLDALIDYELSLAKANLDCSYDDAANEIYAEYNKKFVDDNALAILEFFNG